MVNIRGILIIGFIILGGLVVFFWFFAGDEAKIKKQFKTLAELASKDSDEHQIIAAANARKIGDMFAESSRFEIPSHSISKNIKKENIASHVMMARSLYSVIALKFHDIQINFLEKDTAEVTFTAYMEARSVSGQPIREVNEFVSRMEKIEKDWYFNQIKAVSVLER